MPEAQALRRSLVLALVPALAAFALALLWPAASEASHCSQLEGAEQQQCVEEAEAQCEALGVDPGECEESATGQQPGGGKEQTDKQTGGEGTGGGDGTQNTGQVVNRFRSGCAPGFHAHNGRGCHRIGLRTGVVRTAAVRTCAPGYHAHDGRGCHRHFVQARLAQTGFDALPFALLGLVSLGGAFLLRRRLRHDS